MSVTRGQIVEIARGFIGTPFHHRGRLPGVGIDCAGVPVCAARLAQIVGPDFDVPEYAPTPDGRTMLEWCREYLGPQKEQADLAPSDVLVLRISQHPQHLALVAEYSGAPGVLSIIHASNVHKRVVEQRLMYSSRQRFVAAFEFPGAIDG